MGENDLERREQSPRDSLDFLEKLQKRESILDDSRIAVVVAHPDDESIAFGAQLPRFPRCLMVHVTDGAPESPKEWQKNGFDTQAEYAVARADELKNALDIAGHTGPRVSLGVTDQQVAFQLIENIERLVTLFINNNIRFVLTHSYEGGHPDHDATAFAVHMAKAIMAKEKLPLEIIEAPIYRGEIEDITWQSFVPSKNNKTFSLPLSAEERNLKEQLFEAHKSQQTTFPKVSLKEEQLRVAPAYNFTQLPNEGILSRIFTKAKLTEDRWLELTNEASQAFEV
ncbi:MAG: PIG-L family deacetylase [Patescibacteria group bacterium]